MRPRSALTIVELLVVIGLIGVLMALLLPAVHAVRESARQTQCQENLRQLGLGVLNHQAAHGFFPTGGWSYAWIGDPDRGFGERQPGGWVFNVLPYIEEQALRAKAANSPLAEKERLLAEMSQTPLDLFHCPTRSRPDFIPYRADMPPRNAQEAEFVAASDYAINAGDGSIELCSRPTSYAEADSPEYRWPDTTSATGISYLRSRVRPRDITDGASKTYLLGEKYVMTDAGQGIDDGNDQSMYTGYDYDTYRWTWYDNRPHRDGRNEHAGSFGSAHAPGFFIVLADGSVTLIAYDVDIDVHRSFGNRRDGQTPFK